MNAEIREPWLATLCEWFQSADQSTMLRYPIKRDEYSQARQTCSHLERCFSYPSVLSEFEP
ncbi:hypothetical protein SynSYN20_01591 [Synechococcus sp. SYN20]|uniref:hypothetical protein n=1 Tax=Synechococcus sp. SYN20 TaxID=1050714 RepID=UPI0016449088|nr:hypothetical protein [Synechococcus sp. SYN20]QNJ25918.1 hypothetical protein SynSYN20_01591 [Synechococcus sp. SYN20]